MEKILLKKMGITFLIIYIFIFVIFSGLISERNYRQSINELDKALEQVETTYKNSLKNQAISQQLFKQDYLSRIKLIDYILKNRPDEISNVKLLKLKDFIEVKNIFLVDKDGNILESNDETFIGHNLLKDSKLTELKDWYANKNRKVSFVDMNAISLDGKSDIVYFGIKSENDYYDTIQVEVNKYDFEKAIAPASIDKIIENTPTVYEDAFFIVDKDTGTIKAITRNNEQSVRFDDINNDDKKAYIDKLLECKDGKLVDFNKKSNLLITKDMGDVILCVSMNAKPIYQDIIANILYLLLVCVIIFIITMLVTAYNIKKYVLMDLFKFKDSINLLMKNNYDVEFKATYDTELKDLAQLLNWWRDSYKHKSQRMTRLVSKIDINLAMFESLSSIDKTFCSENVKTILNIDDENWQKYLNDTVAFKAFIKSLVHSYTEYDNIIKYQDKFLKIVLFEDENEFYGIIYDNTERLTKEKEVQSIIEQAEFKSEIDRLTQIYNRYGLDKKMNEIIADNGLKGILFIFDLDNFKVVNDNEGHPIGDMVLKKFAETLKEYFRSEDIIARIGGDEFVVFMRNYMEEDKMLKRVNDFLEHVTQKLDFYNKQYNLSTSVGVVYSRDDITRYEELYAYADAALYKAKRQGKNRVCINKEYRICIDKDCSTCKGLCPKMMSN